VTSRATGSPRCTSKTVPATAARCVWCASRSERRGGSTSAIAAITGWDPRTASSGDQRKVDEAVAAALDECVLVAAP
jgi:hypothetical protein